jgi:CheY-like chemotaxis protein
MIWPLSGQKAVNQRSMSNSNAPQSFIDDLHKALQALYDPPELRSSALVVLFDLAENANPAAALRHLLLDSIQALKPEAGVPLHAKPWLLYNVLKSRFVEQITQKEAAVDLMLSIRTMRRFEKNAVQGLAENLWNQFDLASKFTASPPTETHVATEATGRQEELNRLKGTFPDEQVSLTEVIQSTLQMAAPLFESSQVQVRFEPSDQLPAVKIQTPPLRQALLNLFSLIAQGTPQSTLSITISPENINLTVRLDIHSQGEVNWPEVFKQDELGISRDLVQLSGGIMEISKNTARQEWRLDLTIPIAQPYSVLVIDDNADALRLVERYLNGTRFRFVGTQDPLQVTILAQEILPDVILLDVMLPGVDGWELLARLREHPVTHTIPVIVCTFLPQEQLAYTLGACCFLRKPITRENLLSTLLHEIGPS